MIFVVIALIGAVIASYTDLKHGIIPNKLVFTLFFIGIIGNILINGLKILKPLSISVFSIFILGVFLWGVIPLFSAADSKLLISFGALLPQYPDSLINKFTPILNGDYPFVISILLNTILLAFPILLLYGVYLTWKKGKIRDVIKPLSNFRNIINLSMFFTSLVLASVLINMNFFVVVFFIFFLRIIFRKSEFLRNIFSDNITKNFHQSKNQLSLFLAGSIGGLFVYFKGNVSFLITTFLSLLIGISVFRVMLNSIIIIFNEGIFREIKNIDKIEEGDIISGNLYLENERVVSKNFVDSLLKKYKNDSKPIIEQMARGLSLKEVERLKNLHKEGKIDSISITKAHTFAFPILIGLVVSLALGDLIMVMQNG